MGCPPCKLVGRMCPGSGCVLRQRCVLGVGDLINSFVGRANHCGTHVVQRKNCCALQENVVSKQLILYDPETTDQYVVDCKVLAV